MKAKFEDRKLYIDFLRIIAAFFVIFNHTGGNGFFLFARYPDTTIQYWCYLFASIFCKFSVPLFFMISGAMLIPKNENIKDVYQKRVLKMGITLVLFSLLYYIYNSQSDLSAISIKGFIGPLYESNHNFSYWYIYAFIPYLMALPLLRPFAKSLDNKHFLYILGCALFFISILPIVEYIFWQGRHSLNSNFRMAWVTSNAVLYPLTGYYLENRIDIIRSNRFLPILWILNIITILISCCMTFYRARIMGVCDESRSQTFHNSFVLINCITLYITSRWYFSNHDVSNLVKDIIESIGSATFGVYLFHVMIKKTLEESGMLTLFRETLGINYMVSALLLCLFTFMIGYFITIICKRIPLLKRLI